MDLKDMYLKHVRKWQKDRVILKMMNNLKINKNKKDNVKRYFTKIWEKIEDFMKEARVDEVKVCDDCHVRIPCYPQNQMPQRYYYCNANHCYDFDAVGPRIICMFCGNIDAFNTNKPSYAFDMFLI